MLAEITTQNWYLCIIHTETSFCRRSLVLFFGRILVHTMVTRTQFFVMTDSNQPTRRKRLPTQLLLRTLCIVSSVSMVSRLPGLHGYTCCRTGVWSKSRVTARFAGKWYGEVGKITHRPTLNSTNKNTQSKFDPYLWTCDVSVPPLSSRLSSSSSAHLLSNNRSSIRMIGC